MTAAPVLAEPRAARPRSRLGTRLALVLMPLVLIPVMLMGAAAYLRTQDLIRLQVVSRLSSAVVNNPKTSPIINHRGVVAYFSSSHQPISVGTPIIHGIASASPTVPIA